MAEDATQHAARLLDLWSDLAIRHVALGSSCACGAGGVSLRLEDFELDIVGYLDDSGSRSGVEEVVSFFQELQKGAPREQPLRSLLQDIERDRIPLAVSAWLLPKVERTLRSFAELHGPRVEE